MYICTDTELRNAVREQIPLHDTLCAIAIHAKKCMHLLYCLPRGKKSRETSHTGVMLVEISFPLQCSFLFSPGFTSFSSSDISLEVITVGTGLFVNILQPCDVSAPFSCACCCFALHSPPSLPERRRAGAVGQKQRQGVGVRGSRQTVAGTS